LETRYLDKITPYDRNPRKNKAAVDRVLESLNRHGQIKPIVLSAKGKPFEQETVCAGHTTLEALKRFGAKEAKVVIKEFADEAQFIDYNIRDNKSSEFAEWDEQMLADLGAEFDVDLAEMGFDFDMPEEEGETDPDDAPEPPEEPKSRLGQVYQLGNHRLMCGDSTKQEDVATLMDGAKANLWITDPPYNVDYEGKTKDSLKIENDSMADDEFRQFLVDCYSAANENMNEGGAFYIWHADSEGYNFRGAAHDIGWKVRQCLMWNKSVMVMGRQDYQWKHEPCLYGWKEGASHFWGSDRKQTTVLEFDKPSRNGEHPTMKPVDLFLYQIKNSTNAGDVVLDSFGGSGTTMIACEMSNRKSCLMEFDPRYVDVIIKRWEDFTGKKAELINAI
jgi:site-specific DNA-methyltransferase (adenine-specific)